MSAIELTAPTTADVIMAVVSGVRCLNYGDGVAVNGADASPAEDVPPYEPGSLSRLHREWSGAVARQDDMAAKALLEKMRLVVLSMRGLTFTKGSVL